MPTVASMPGIDQVKVFEIYKLPPSALRKKPRNIAAAKGVCRGGANPFAVSAYT